MAHKAKGTGGPATSTRGQVTTTFTPTFGKGRKGKGRSSKMRGKSGR